MTSAVPGEGVSTIATALAVHYASAGRGVLLVDLDRRSGGAPQRFGIAAGPALSSYLAGEVDLESVIQTDPRTGVDFIAWGERLGPAYLDLHKISRILDLARDRNQLVIFDGPPVLATSETARLATVTDRTLLVVEWGGTKKKLIELAIDKLREATSDEVLVTINKVNPRKHMQYGFKDGGVFTPELRAYHAA